MIYLDTAALVKLVRCEPESDALADWLDEREGQLLVTSVLADVELPRALRRGNGDGLNGVLHTADRPSGLRGSTTAVPRIDHSTA